MNSDSPLTILTERPGSSVFSPSYIKHRLKDWLGKTRGPQSVFSSLTRGLSGINHSFNVNPKNENEVYKKVLVLSGVDTLSWAIHAKQKGFIEELYAGPNIIVSPLDHHKIIINSLIDKVVVPSVWVQQLYERITPELTGKIIVWGAGVNLPQKSSTKGGQVLVVKKHIDQTLYESVIATLHKEKISYKLLSYGDFTQEEYFTQLEQTPYVIYLQRSESQGLALLEAWARNVPTLVYNAQRYVDPQTTIDVEGKIGAPYLTEQTGMFFTDTSFERDLSTFISKYSTFTPREYINDNFTDTIAAQHLIEQL